VPFFLLLCVTLSPNAGSSLLAAFKTTFNQTELPRCCVELGLTPLPYASSSDGHHHHTSRSPRLWTRPARLVSCLSLRTSPPLQYRNSVVDAFTTTLLL
jgi:hypothetical protein